MTALPKKKFYTSEEYLALEEKAEFRSEYNDGVITAMAGGTASHIRITNNIDRLFGDRLSSSCESMTSDMKARVRELSEILLSRCIGDLR